MKKEQKQQCECGSENIRYDPNHGFYECLTCEAVWGHDEDDPDYDECAEEHDYGACCACDTTGPTVRNFIGLEKEAPVPGQGWGCVICELPCNGALAVICDSCLEAERLPTQAIYGYPSLKRRISLGALIKEFKHKDGYHDAEENHTK